MKSLLVLLVIAACSGVVVGYVATAREYRWTDDEFGHFTKQSDLEPAGLLAHMEQLQQKNLPRAEVVGGEQHDFGSMLRNAKGSHDFTIKNTGDEPLDLEVRATTCKCTLGELDNSQLQPGESTTVHMTWSVKTKGEQFQQTATIGTNDPLKGEVQLKIKGQVLDKVMMTPLAWNVGEVSAGSPIEMESTVYSRMDYDLRHKQSRWLEEVLGAEPSLEIQARAIDPVKDAGHTDARQAFDVRLRVPPGLNQGPMSYGVQLEFEPVDPALLESEEASEIVLLTQMEGRIVGDITLKAGSRLSGRDGGGFTFRMPAVDVGEGAEENVLVFLRGPQRNQTRLSIGEIDPPRVLGAELGEPKVKDELVVYPLKLRIREDAPAMERSGNSKDDYGTIWIESDNKNVAPLMLRVKFNVRQAAF